MSPSESLTKALLCVSEISESNIDGMQCMPYQAVYICRSFGVAL